MSSSLCDAMLLAAGHGTRLRPLTDHTPKPLISVGGKTLLARNLSLLAAQGFTRVFVNVHHLGEQIENAVGDGSSFGLRIEISREPVLLDTGGGVGNIASRVESNELLVMNSDVLISPAVSLRALVSAVREDSRRPAAALLLREDPRAESFGAIGIDESTRIVRFLDVSAGPPAAETLMFCGVSVLSRALLESMPKPGSIFSLTRDTLRNAVAGGSCVLGKRFDGYWNDVGTPERLAEAEGALGPGGELT